MLKQEVERILDEHLIETNLKKCRLEVGGTAEEMAERLERFYLHRRQQDGIDLAYCDTCDKFSDPELDDFKQSQTTPQNQRTLSILYSKEQQCNASELSCGRRSRPAA